MQQQLNTPYLEERGETATNVHPIVAPKTPIVRFSFFCIFVPPPEIQLYHASTYLRSPSMRNLIIVDPSWGEAVWQQSYRLTLLSC